MIRYALVFLAACSHQPEVADPAAPDTDLDVCVKVFQQQRTCTAQYIPALVDLRAKLDTPPGIKDQVAAHRDDVIAQAKEEWTHDSTDDAIRQTCAQLSKDHAAVAEAQACLAKTACDPFVACIMPVTEKHLHK